MVTAKQLRTTIESTLLVSATPSPSQMIELIYAIRHSLPSPRSLLSFLPPKPSDRAQVESKEVRLPDSGPIPLDDQDVQIALKLSDDLHLNEIDCVRLLVSANQELGLQGRGPLHILRLTTGLWYTERRDLITALYTLLRAIVLDQGLEVHLQADILKYVEDLINGGLRQRVISLLKELNREEPAGLGGPNSDRYILDSNGALVERRAVVCRERLFLGHCLVLSLLVVRASPEDVKDIYTVLKDSAGDTGSSTDIVKKQITYSLLSSLIIYLISDAVSALPDQLSILAQDTSFRHDFHKTVMAMGNDPTIEDCMVCVRLAWAVHLMIIQEANDARDANNYGRINSCVEAVMSRNAFRFFLNTVLRTPSYQNDDEDMIYMYNAYLHKLITSFLPHPVARDKVKEAKEQAMTVLSPHKMSGSHDFVLDGNKHSQQVTESFPQTFVSLLEFVSEIYEKETELISANDVIWTFVKFTREDHNNFQTLVAFLKMLSTLASSEEGASKVYEFLHGRTFCSISWSTLFDCLSIYEEKFKQSSQNAGPILPEIQEGDAKALVAYLCVLRKELNREEPTGSGGPNSDRYILDSRGALVERRAVVCRERLILGNCLVLSLLVIRASPEDVKDIYTVLKDSAGDTGGSTDIVKNQITYSLISSLIISLISDALSALPDQLSILAQDSVMAMGNDPTIEDMVFVRLAWAVHLMIIQEANDARDANKYGRINSCVEAVISRNTFQFFLNTGLRTPSYQNDDEDMISMYNAYLHKLITSFLPHPVARDKVKETKEQAMTVLSPYKMSGSHDFILDGNKHSQQVTESFPQTFVSLLEFVSEIYEKETKLLSGNDVIWTFVTFTGEDHNNFQTLVAFLKMLSTLASSEEGASKVYELLHGRTFRSISWSTLFDCLSIYEEKFKQSSQSAGPILPEIQEGDAKAVVACLCVLHKVLENGFPIERKTWFPDIEPLFKLLSYEYVPPYLKGALRNSISTFIHVSPNLKDAIWGFLEQYDLPVVVGPQAGQIMGSQVYDMRFELNEVEARSEHYPSTISFLNLLNALIAEERDATDRGRRFIGSFRFIYDHVFGTFSQRAYADPYEKWQLGVVFLQHFQMILNMYDIKDEDADIVASQTQLMAPQSTPIQMQLPVIQLLKDFMSGKTVFRKIMGILLPGVDAIIADRTNHTYDLLLEKAVLLSLGIIILVLEKDLLVSDFWRPLYQPFDVVLSQDHNQIVALLEYIRYDFHPRIQQLSIKLMGILRKMSGRSGGRRDRLSEMPTELLQTIFLKLDLPELRPLEAVNRMYRRLIRSPDFIKAYNARDDASGWSIVHIVNDHSPVIGALYLIRHSDGRRLVVPLRDVLVGIAHEDGDMSLLGAYGSLVLLRYNPMVKNLPLKLIVVNLYNGQVHSILVPRPPGFTLTFNWREHVQLLRDNLLDHPLAFKINYVGIGTDFVPRYSTIRFLNGEYRWNIQIARHLEEYENLAPFDSDTSMIHFVPAYVYLVSSGLNESVYKNPNEDDQDNHPPTFEHAGLGLDEVDPDDGWETITTYHYGKDGWAVLMVRHAHPFAFGLTRLHGIHLFKLRDDWRLYQHVSSVEPNLLNQDIFNITCGCHVEQTGGKVNIAFIMTEDEDEDEDDDDDEDDAGYGVRHLMHFSYDRLDNTWIHRVTPIVMVTDARRPVFTSRLTVGNMQA